MIQLNKYLREIGIDEDYWLFRNVDGDKRYLQDEEGFVPIEFWDLDVTLAIYIYSHLCYFRDHYNNGYPSGMTEQQWNKCLDDMITAFKLLIQNDSNYKSKNRNKKIKYGLRLFAKHFTDLWY